MKTSYRTEFGSRRPLKLGRMAVTMPRRHPREGGRSPRHKVILLSCHIASIHVEIFAAERRVGVSCCGNIQETVKQSRFVM